MYTGHLIEELIETVERAEMMAREGLEMQFKKAMISTTGYATYIYEPIVMQQVAVA
jgi:hypothetical protein